MSRGLWIVLLLSYNWICTSAGSGVTYCDENSPTFNQCIEDVLNKLIPSLRHGWSNEELPGIDPISVPAVNTTRKDDSMDITLSTSNVIMTGLADSRVHAVKSKNLFMGKLEIVMKVPVIEITGRYDTEGEIATFPLSSNGHFNITMDDVTVVCIVYLERYKMGEEGRLAVHSLSLDAVPGQIHIVPAQYLDGDQKLGKTLEVYLNENAYELYNLVKEPLMKYLSDITRIMVNTYMAQVPDNNHLMDYK